MHGEGGTRKSFNAVNCYLLFRPQKSKLSSKVLAFLCVATTSCEADSINQTSIIQVYSRKFHASNNKVKFDIFQSVKDIPFRILFRMSKRGYHCSIGDTFRECIKKSYCSGPEKQHFDLRSVCHF